MTKSKSEEAFEKWCKENGKSERWDGEAWQAATKAMLEFAREKKELISLHRCQEDWMITIEDLETYVNGEVGE